MPNRRNYTRKLAQVVLTRVEEIEKRGRVSHITVFTLECGHEVTKGTTTGRKQEGARCVHGCTFPPGETKAG